MNQRCWSPLGEEFSSLGHKFLDSKSGGSRLYDEDDPTRIGGMWDAHIGGVCGGGGAAHHPRVFFGSRARSARPDHDPLDPCQVFARLDLREAGRPQELGDRRRLALPQFDRDSLSCPR